MHHKNKSWFLLSLSLLFAISFSCYADTINTLFRQANNPLGGNPHGKITIVEFFDYQCSHCVTMASVIDNIVKNNPDVRVVYKDFPIRGPMSDLAARAALAANKQGKYALVNHAILASSQPLSELAIMNAAKNSGVNMSRLQKDMNSANIGKQIKTNFDLAINLKISGTPAFYIGKTDAQNMKQVIFILGEMNQLQLQKAINDARK